MGATRTALWRGVLLAFLQRCAAWVLMSSDGTLTFVAPLEIDSAWGYSKLSFKKNKLPKWDLYNDANDFLRISQIHSTWDDLVVIPASAANSMQHTIKFSRTLS